MTSYLLGYVVIFIGICCHIYWNMLSYLLEYVVISIGICCHIYWNTFSYLLEYITIYIIICHIYLLLYSKAARVIKITSKQLQA